MIKAHPQLSINRQCKLLCVSKGALYYKPAPENPYNLLLMDLIDKQHTKTPFYGSRRLTVYLEKVHGHNVNRKRVQSLMRKMRIEAIYPKSKTTKADKKHKIYPYLLKGLQISRPNQVWSTDITYVRVGNGFGYLTAIIDWRSRYVLSWRLSNTLENSFCVEALEEAFGYGQPEIFNTDQGSQYTASNFLKPLIERGVSISMDSKGRALDNIFVERLWRSVKYEKIYLNEYNSMLELYNSLKEYFYFYNNERFHQSLNYKTPKELYPIAGQITNLNQS